MRDVLNVVVIHQNAEQADNLVDALRTSANVVKATFVRSTVALGDALEGLRPDLVLGHCGVPAFSCEEVLSVIREKLPDVATILFPEGYDEDERVRLFLAGADEFVSPEQIALLTFAGERALGRASDRQSARAATAASGKRLQDTRHALLSGLFDATVEAIICADQNQRIVLLNPAAESLFGYHLTEIMGRPLNLLVPDRYHELHSGYVDRFALSDLNRRRMGSFRPVMARRKDGREFPIEATISKWQGDDGTILTVVLRQTGEMTELEHSRSVLAAIVESAEDAIVGKTLDGIIRSWSPGAQRIFGYRHDEIIGKHVTLLIPADRLGEERMIIDRVERGERVESYESRRLRKDGTEIDVSLTISPIRSEDGTIIGASKIARDITRRLAAERSERRQLALYSALSQTNHALRHAHEPAALYQEICRVCVEHGRVILAYVVVARDGIAVPVAAAGKSSDYLSGLVIRLSAADGDDRGPAEMAYLSGDPCICNDFLADPITKNWRERAASLGTQAAACFPFRRGGKVEGLIILHAGERHYFDRQMVELLAEMAEDVTFGLDNFDRETARMESELALRRSEASLASAQKCASLGNWDADLTTGKVHWSAEMVRQMALESEVAPKELSAFIDFIHPEDREQYAAAFELAVRTGSASSFEFRRHPGRGPLRWFSLSIEGHFGASGSVSAVTGAVQDITDRKQTEQRILHLGTHDALTNLPNRVLMRDRISQALAVARRTGHHAAVVFVDLDRFKFINDAYGHLFGDLVIRAVAARLSSVIREGDSVGRLGGDEFLVLLVDIPRRVDVHVAAQKILECLRMPLEVDGREVAVTASIGVSIFPEDGADVDVLIGNADISMYRAKDEGRNSYQFFTSEISEETQRRVQLVNDLRFALEREQISLVYQPKVNLLDGAIIGCEALVRWQHPELGAISPARFIPVAEENGMILPIGDWILRSACAQAKRWQEAGLPPIVMAVNLSARQFRQQDVIEWVRNVLVEVDLDPESIELELTESLLADDMESVVESINGLKAMGIKLSIDDFGTGFSSLSYLKRFSVDTLKIDQSFIRNMMTEPADATIALAIIGLAHSLRLSVIAEGVETREQCDILRASGCDAMQGYLFSRPVAAEQMELLLRNGQRLDF